MAKRTQNGLKLKVGIKVSAVLCNISVKYKYHVKLKSIHHLEFRGVIMIFMFRYIIILLFWGIQKMFAHKYERDKLLMGAFVRRIKTIL